MERVDISPTTRDLGGLMKRLVSHVVPRIAHPRDTGFRPAGGEQHTGATGSDPARKLPTDWWLLGDGYLQRQVEPTIAASTLNPDHLLAFFNDYRAIDAAEGDVGLGEGEVAAIEAAVKLAKLVSPRRPLPTACR